MSTSGHFSASSLKHHVHEPVSGTQIGVTESGAIKLFTGDTMCADLTPRGTSRRAGRVEHVGRTSHHVSSAHMAA